MTSGPWNAPQTSLTQRWNANDSTVIFHEVKDDTWWDWANINIKHITIIFLCTTGLGVLVADEDGITSDGAADIAGIFLYVLLLVEISSLICFRFSNDTLSGSTKLSSP